MNVTKLCLLLILLPALSSSAWSHHILGRPSYNLNEDSNTPPSMQAEFQIGDFLVTYMVFPAFPSPNERGRINIYMANSTIDAPFQGEISFTTKEDSWFASEEQVLGAQVPYDGVYRQGFEFDRAGDYIITASYVFDGESYHLDFPLRIGEPGTNPVAIVAVLLLVLLLGLSLLRAKRIQRDKIRFAQRATRGIE
jgi:hypothetical protein